MEIELGSGKYTYIVHQNGKQEALRYGVPWRDLTGDGLILCMAEEIYRLRNEIEAAKAYVNRIS